MPEFATPSVLENHAFVPQINDRQIDTILEDFRDWLHQAADSAASDDDDEPEETVDLHTLTSQYIALRHEINLQTKAARSQQEQSGQALDKLNQALEMAQQIQKRNREQEAKEQEEQLRPLVKTLVDVYDVMALARREVDRVQQVNAAAEAPLSTPTELKLPFWARWLGFRLPLQHVLEQNQKALQERMTNDVQRTQGLLDSIVTGYTMSLQRLERTLKSLELEAIPTVGQTFDPEKMEVVEVAADTGRANMEVLDEVRRGYIWRGRVFRFAQVRVAKS